MSFICLRLWANGGSINQDNQGALMWIVWNWRTVVPGCFALMPSLSSLSSFKLCHRQFQQLSKVWTSRSNPEKICLQARGLNKLLQAFVQQRSTTRSTIDLHSATAECKIIHIYIQICHNMSALPPPNPGALCSEPLWTLVRLPSDALRFSFLAANRSLFTMSFFRYTCWFFDVSRAICTYLYLPRAGHRVHLREEKEKFFVPVRHNHHDRQETHLRKKSTSPKPRWSEVGRISFDSFSHYI